MANPQTSVVTMPRRIILCMDGTWNNTYDEQKRDDGSTVLKPSNPLKTCRAVLPIDSDGNNQIAYYHIGIGSLAEYPGIPNRLLHFSDRILGGAWGAGFEENIEETLHFLALNLQDGDEVFVFGFSRGAATARGLTRFLDWNGGLTQKEDAYFLPRLFRAYILSHGDPDARDPALEQINTELVQRDKRSPLRPFRPVVVRYLGVWDTVMALGSRFRATGKSTSEPGWTFYAGVTPAACVKHARQALAVDEARYEFRPEIWSHAHPGQQMEQRWFAGVHSNVGGGYVNDGLANIAFHWILDGAKQEGLQIDREYAAHFKPFPWDSLYDSSSLMYRFLEAIRFRTGRGKRHLVKMPAAANFELDKTVVQRIRAKPESLQPGGDLRTHPYRPENVLLFLACQPDLSAYLASIGITDLAEKPLPDDVTKRIGELRNRCKNSGL